MAVESVQRGSRRGLPQRGLTGAAELFDFLARTVTAVATPRARLLRRRRRALRWGLLFGAGCLFWTAVTLGLAAWGWFALLLEITGAVSVLATGGFDGLSVSADGTELFAEDNQHVYGYTLSTNAVVFDSGFIAGADGALVANLAGTPVLFVNTNYGDIYEVALSDSTQTLIADSGSRGDIAALDTSNNTAIFSQSNTLVRLSLPAGSSFGVTAVPEPASLALFGIGLFGIARLRRARVNKA